MRVMSEQTCLAARWQAEISAVDVRIRESQSGASTRNAIIDSDARSHEMCCL